MINVPISIRETQALRKISEPVSVSIPFENSKVFNTNTLILVNNDQQNILCQITPLALWPNNSLKWVRVDFQYSINENSTNTIYLKSSHSEHSIEDNSIQIKETPKLFFINTGSIIFQVNKNELGIFTLEDNNNLVTQINSLILTDNENRQYIPKITASNFNKILADHSNKLKITLQFSGSFQNSQQESTINFKAEITFYLNKSYIKFHIVLHNPNSMVHSGGKWDLGNENSIFLKSFNAVFNKQSNDLLYCKTNETNPWKEYSPNELLIFQSSSGGENWQSKNHINHQGKVTLEFNGYRLTSSAQQEPLEKAERASPTIHINHGASKDINKTISNSSLTMHIENFWQKFPKAIEVNANSVTLGLFPHQATGGFELQPGEKKSDTFYVDYGGNKDQLHHFESPIHISVCVDYLTKTKAIPFFSTTESETSYNDIINDGINSANNFFHKRELIDEFGWRNFGDLYADHETLECLGNDELISHFNNQYDPLYGLLKQYLTTNNLQWLTLANDLADHVKNIDIYHTTQDRNEYNGGLFWHTDHYLPAETASHRTYSKHQISNAYQDHAGGGGPGGQHCYTTGLMLHYFLTGDESSKQAVTKLSNWITNVYEGSGTLADFLLAIKNKNRNDTKNIFTGKYPLDRGTGHYITALIDTYELTGKQSYLDKASLIIKNTIHPEDDIEARNLDNVEECWFYTVLLQAIYRYLQTKENSYQFDRSFNYAKNALLHYANWMCKNEQPYLTTPENLEYPNHTWAAQDIRKANILYMASYFAKNETLKQSCQDKANSIYNYVIQTLSNEPTRSFTRILSILMQNHGIKSYVEKFTFKHPNDNSTLYKQVDISTNRKLVNAFLVILSNTSLSKELTWLRKRSTSVDQLFKKLGK